MKPETFRTIAIFVLAVAVLAFYAGYSGMSSAPTRPRSKYFLVVGVIVTSVVLLCLFIYYVPAMSTIILMTVVGTFSLVLGLFAIFVGLAMKEGAEAPVPPHVFILSTCGIPIKTAGRDTPQTGTPGQSPVKPEEKPPQ